MKILARANKKLRGNGKFYTIPGIYKIVVLCYGI